MQSNFKKFLGKFSACLSILLIILFIVFAGYIYSEKNNHDNIAKNTVREASNAFKEEEIPKKTETDIQTQQNNDTQNIICETASTSSEHSNITEYSLPSFGEITIPFDENTLTYSSYYGDWRTHNGIDFDGTDTPDVFAAATGIVEKIYDDPAYGLTVMLSHQDGCKTTYSSLESIAEISEGDAVEKGDTIGVCGDKCECEKANGKHLHFSAMKDNKYFNPF